MANLQLTSAAFSQGDEIPRKFGYKNGNASPPLTISGILAEAKSLVLIMDDPDAMGAVGKVWVHWVVWNIDPTTTEIAEYTVPNGAIEGMTDFGERGYGGPAPPDKRHTYIFKLYALDSKLDLPNESTKADVEKAMEGHILEQTNLKGTYAP
jgi:Raf kinase inhibitor-like YbhB/YbcL family protein